MSEGDRNEFIRHRTEALATVFLTRRPDVQITSFGSGIDLFARIIPSKKDDPVGFFGFGVKLAGTGISLPDEDAANRYGKHLVPRIVGREREFVQYYFPVLMLLFTMDEDRGYYSWVTEPILVPGQCKAQLRRVTTSEFRPLDRATLDEIVEKIKSWYKELAKEIFDQ